MYISNKHFCVYNIAIYLYMKLSSSYHKIFGKSTFINTRNMHFEVDSLPS